MDQSLTYFLFDTVTRMFSPYELNPLDFNPLRDVLDETIDFAALRDCDKVKLFISTTKVSTGKVRVFNCGQLTRDVAMASACLPYLFKAVEIDGEAYWDGGFMGNPALFPLFHETCARDVIIVHINPIERPELPTTSPQIMNRVNEISFNSSLIKELRSIAFVKKLIAHDMLKDVHKDHFKDILVHSVRADGALCDLSVASKFDSDWGFLTYLRDTGRQVMDRWLATHYDAVGQHDTVDLHHDFLESVSRMFGQPEKPDLDARDCAL
jgi:NTE family protein